MLFNSYGHLLRQAKGIARRLYAYPTPVYLPGVAEVGRDAGAVRAQLELTLAACREIPEVTCLEPTPFYARREYYYNLTHLNQRGHRALADWFDTVIVASRGGGVPSSTV